MQLQDENQLTLIVLKVRGVNETRHVKKIAKLCQKGKKMKNKSQNSRKKKVDCTQVRYIEDAKKIVAKGNPSLLHCTSTR